MFRAKKTRRPVLKPSVIGLAADPLAPRYPRGADLVVRCADIATLDARFMETLEKVDRALPAYRLYELPPETQIRARFDLPDDAAVDRVRPFAFVRTKAGWVGVLPLRGAYADTSRLRRLDGGYAVAGSPEALAAYEPGLETGFHLPGAISVFATGDARAELGAALADAGKSAGMALPVLPGLPDAAFEHVARIDAALRFEQDRARLDVRLAPSADREAALSRHLASVHAHGGLAARWLPDGAAVEIATHCDAASWVDLAGMLGLVGDERTASLARDLLSVLGDDASVQLHLREGQPAVALLVADLAEPDQRAAARFLAGDGIETLLERLRTGDGRLSFKRGEFERNGVSVGAITGHFGRERIRDWRARGGVHAALATLLDGPVLVYVALSGNRLCAAFGERSRKDMEALLDGVGSGAPRRASPGAALDALRKSRLLGARVDLAPILRRAGAPSPEHALPVSFAAAVDGGGLRFAVRVPAVDAANVAARLLASD